MDKLLSDYIHYVLLDKSSNIISESFVIQSANVQA